MASFAMFSLLLTAPINTSAEEIEVTEETTSETIDYEAEKQKALDAGYTLEQFEAIMQIPELESVAAPPMLRATSQQNAIVTVANQQIGKPYQWGAQGPNSFDCGGLVKYVYKQAVNIELPMGTFNQERYGTEVSTGAMQPGDLMFYGPRGNTTHVAIYIGSGTGIHAPQPGQNVQRFAVSGFPPAFARRILSSERPNTDGQQAGEAYIFRMYNTNNGRHFYTQNSVEANNLVNAGWAYEGVGWVAHSSGAPVYRLYNPNNGKHHYTMNGNEKDSLVRAGWRYEQIAWYSGGSIPVYRLYNPNSGNGDSHHYTVNTYERDNLVRAGWRNEGVGFYAKRLKQ